MSLPSFNASLEIVGDGRLRAEEAVARAVSTLAARPEVREFFAAHPNLRTLDPTPLFGQVSRKRASRLIESGFLDTEDFALEPDRVIPRGRTLEVTLPFPLLLAGLDYLPPAPSRDLPPIDVLFEDERWLAVNKPHDLPSAPIRSDETDSAVHRTLAVRPDLPILRGNPLEPGLVHRLDNGTGGVLLFAKTQAAFAGLESSWNSGAVAKIYRALSSERPPADLSARLPKRVDLQIGHDAKSKRRMRVEALPTDARKLRGDAMTARTAITRVTPGELGGKSVTDFEIRIETGIHHQIRATLAHLGFPILGDSVYGGAPSERLWLQAWKLVLPGSKSGDSLEIAAPLPSGWPSSPRS
jgi:23S rRNA pseudouridine1911/1915/1917 synthase